MTAIVLAVGIAAASCAWVWFAPRLPVALRVAGYAVLAVALVGGVYVSLSRGMASPASGVVTGVLLGGMLGWFARPEADGSTTGG